MPDDILIQTGTAVVWADTTDYSSTVTGLARTDQLDLTSLAAAAARQGAKADLGATRADFYHVYAGIEFAVAPTSADLLAIYLGFSPSATAGNANPGGLSGADAAYTGTTGDSIDDSVLQLKGPFRFSPTADATTVVQYQYVGEIWRPERYCSPLVYNTADQALVADAVEMLIALIPINLESQA